MTGPRFLSERRTMISLLFFRFLRFFRWIRLKLQWGFVLCEFNQTSSFIFVLNVDSLCSNSLQPGSGCQVERR